MKLTKSWKIAIAAVAVGLLAILSFIGSYNGLVDKEAKVDQSAADLDVQLQRRFYLIPNLVSAVKGALAQESKVFDSIAQARTRYAGAQTSQERLAAGAEVESSLGRLLVVMENYPQLASLQNVRDLQVQLEGTENRVAQARRGYNETVTSFNTAIRRLPGSIIAAIGGFERRELFKVQQGADQAPSVDLSSK